MMMRWCFLLCFLCLSVSAAAAPEADPTARLDRVQQQLERSQQRQQTLEAQQKALGEEVDTLRPRLVQLTEDSERTAAELSELESGLADLEGAAARRSAALASQRAEMAQTLSMLQRLALTPPEVQLLSPAPPLDRLHADLQIKALLPLVEKRSREIADTVTDLRRLQSELQSRRRRIVAERASLVRQQSELKDLLAEREAKLALTRQQRSAEMRRAETLASEAADLRDLVEKLEAERQQREAAAAQARAAETDSESGSVPERPDATEALPVATARPLPDSVVARLPVVGAALVRFGERDSLGNMSKGLTLRVRPSAQVVSVATGRIAFAGPFRGYGRILIVEHAAGYHTVLAGLAEVSVEVGQRISAGEPVGHMAATTDPAPQLYYEVRKGGDPVDPLGDAAKRLTERSGR